MSDALLERLEAYVAQVHTPEAQVFGEQYEFEYYRRFVICLKARMQRTLEHWSNRATRGAALPVMPFTLRRDRTSWRRRCRLTARWRSSSATWKRCARRWRTTAACVLRAR